MRLLSAMSLLIFLITLSIKPITIVESHCCPSKTTVLFRPENDDEVTTSGPIKISESTCRIESARVSATFTEETWCEVEVCDDGEPHIEEFYCTTRPCYFFGCFCQGSCYSNNLGLDATTMFNLKYGRKVFKK